MHCKLYVDKIDIVDKLNETLMIVTYNTSIALYAIISEVYTKVATDALLLTINNNIALKVNTTTLTSYSTRVSCDALWLAINHNIALKSDITILTSYYTKVATDALLLTINNNIALNYDITALTS